MMTSLSARRWPRPAVLFVSAVAAVLLVMPRPAAAHPPCCIEWVNPPGQTIPPAGFTTSPGTNPHSGVNDDGFFLVGTTDGSVGAACKSGDSNVTLFDCLTVVFDENTGSFLCTNFGTQFCIPGDGCDFSNGTILKYTEANGATPGVVPMAANNGKGDGKATVVEFHINGTGDLAVCSDETGTCIVCPVPPPPR